MTVISTSSAAAAGRDHRRRARIGNDRLDILAANPPGRALFVERVGVAFPIPAMQALIRRGRLVPSRAPVQGSVNINR